MLGGLPWGKRVYIRYRREAEELIPVQGPGGILVCVKIQGGGKPTCGLGDRFS